MNASAHRQIRSVGEFFLSQYGCMPSGSLLHTAVLLEQWQDGGGSGITALYTVRGFVR